MTGRTMTPVDLLRWLEECEAKGAAASTDLPRLVALLRAALEVVEEARAMDKSLNDWQPPRGPAARRCRARRREQRLKLAAFDALLGEAKPCLPKDGGA